PQGLLLDGSGNLYVAESGASLVRRLVPETVVAPPALTAPPVALSVVNSASLVAGPVAPGEAVTIFGAGLGPESGVTGTPDAAGLVANIAGGTEVRFDGVPAPVFYAQFGQVNVQAPYTLAGAAQTSLEVRYLGQPVASVTLAVVASAPA